MQYFTQNLQPVHRLHFSWDGWPTDGTSFAAVRPCASGPSADRSLIESWKSDGLLCLSETWTPPLAQLVFRTAPTVSPVAFTQRAKGRLQHALRHAGTPVAFSRKTTMRALGENIDQTVINYVRDQLEHADLADPRYRKRLADAAIEDAATDLASPSETASGRYWYNLHIVLVTARRYRVGQELKVGQWADAARSAAGENDCAIRALAVMPDHVHLAVRGSVRLAPVEIGVIFQNALARIAGCRLWQEQFYVGTFGSYSLGSVGCPP